MVIRDFVVSKTKLSADQATALVSTSREQTESLLSPREIEVLGLLAAGGTTKSIADQLYVSHTTVSNHIQHILHKLDAHSRLEAIRRAEHAGLI
jgi:DNA-binding NarL/FixJ family response regulator